MYLYLSILCIFLWFEFVIEEICFVVCVIVDLKFIYIMLYYIVMKSILVIYLEKWCN